jgi:hypothetical protein
MKLEELFPAWRAASTSENLPWDRRFDLADDDSFYALLGHIVEDQSDASNRRPAELPSICSAIVTDILTLQGTLPPGCNALNLQYLQFESTLVPLMLSLAVGDLGSTHDWIINGCGDECAHGVERQFHSGRLLIFVETDVPWIAGNRRNSFTDWGCAFYYYCRRRAALFEVAVGILPAVLHVLDEMPQIDDRVIETKCMIASWAAVYEHPCAQLLARMLEMLFGAPGISHRARVQIATTFSTKIAELTGHPAREWAAWALERGQGVLGSHEPFHLLLTQVDKEADWDLLQPSLLAAAQHYGASLRPLQVPTRVAQATDQRSGLLGPAVAKAMKFERGDDLLAILTRWYDVPEPRRLIRGALFIALNHVDGVVYLGDQSQIVPRQNVKQLTEIVALTNQALGLAISIEGERAPLEMLDRMGQPDYDLGARFGAALAAVYRWDEVEDRIIADRATLIPFPGQPHPIQALMAAARKGFTLPISSSLQQPAADRPIRRAMLWSADNDNFSGFETDAVQSVLERAGITCDRRSGAEARPEDFYAAYSDPAYDLLWVAGHGQIDRWSDGSNRLLAGDHCIIGIDDLIGLTPADGGRRLFVMNICDVGVSAINGGIQRLGLAPLLAGATQGTISHLWPVRPQVASVFGVLLSHYLTDSDDGHFKAFAAALRAVRGPSRAITDSMRGLIPGLPLMDRLEHADLDTDNIFNWGSACFFQ